MGPLTETQLKWAQGAKFKFNLGDRVVHASDPKGAEGAAIIVLQSLKLGPNDVVGVWYMCSSPYSRYEVAEMELTAAPDPAAN